MTKKTTNFGKNLKFLRKTSGCNQTNLGNKLGLERTSVSNYENDISEPPLQVVVRIANYFGVSLDELLINDLSQEKTQQLRNRRNQTLYEEPEHYKILDDSGEWVHEIKRITEINKHLKEKNTILEDYIATLKQMLQPRENVQHPDRE